MIFSVIIPCYNSQDTIIRALTSVVNQTFSDFEIIIVDDGSIDETKKVLDTYLKEQTISYRYIYQKNKGPSSARNNAVSNSSGKYLAFLDADDEWHPKKLEIQYQYIIKYSSKFLSCKFTLSEYSRFLDQIEHKKYNFRDFLTSNRTSTPCTIIEKEVFVDIGGFDETLKYSEDYNLWLKASLQEELVFLDIALVKLYKKPYGESGLSAQLWNMEKGELKNYSYLYKNRTISPLSYYTICSFSLLKFCYRVIVSSYKRVIK